MNLCPCFPGSCRGGQVIDGKLANGQACREALAADRCKTCGRKPERMNSDWSECSHAECPSRRRAWSERPQPGYQAPGEYSNPLDELFEEK